MSPLYGSFRAASLNWKVEIRVRIILNQRDKVTGMLKHDIDTNEQLLVNSLCPKIHLVSLGTKFSDFSIPLLALP